MINPETGKRAITKKEIQETTLKYCKETLKNNEPEKDFKEKIEEKKQEVKKILETTEGEFESNIETFRENIKKFIKSGKKEL